MTQEKLNKQLLEACNNEEWEKAKELIEQGADVKAKDSVKWTALHLAIYHSNLNMVKFLVKNGADVNAKDIDNDTPLRMAKHLAKHHERLS